jgi:hypothetical protein
MESEGLHLLAPFTFTAPEVTPRSGEQGGESRCRFACALSCGGGLGRKSTDRWVYREILWLSHHAGLLQVVFTSTTCVEYNLRYPDIMHGRRYREGEGFDDVVQGRGTAAWLADLFS